MRILENQSDCIGCGLCTQVCSKNCISMECLEGGFRYPRINENLCVACERCKQFCPVQKEAIQIKPKGCYALLENSEASRYKSASGAASAVFYKQIIQQGGAFCGVRLDENLQAMHDISCTLEDIDAYRDSKYVQSNMEGVWKKIADCLRRGQKVLVTGTPCQIAAVHSRFGDAENLFLCDIICSGVPDPNIFELYKKDLEKQKGQPLKAFYFRDKTNGWKKSNIRAVFADESQEIIMRKDSDYFLLFGSNLFFRECCYNCRFKNFNTHADLTIGDYWGIEKLYPQLDDDGGCSVVLVNTEKGAQFFAEATKACTVVETPLQFAMETHPKLEKSIGRNPYRNLFYRIFKTNDMYAYHKAVKRCTGKSLYDRAMRKLCWYVMR